MKMLLTLLTLLALFSVGEARIVLALSHEEMVKDADVVATLRPMKTVKADIPFKGNRYGYDLEHFQAWITTFRVITVQKGELDKGTLLKLVHFSYSDKHPIVINGARFISFQTEEMRKEILAKPEKLAGKFEESRYFPDWLSYLKKRKDGMYEPVSDQYDSALSFKTGASN